MNQEVPHPTTAMVLPGAGSVVARSGASRAARRQSSGCDATSCSVLLVFERYAQNREHVKEHSAHFAPGVEVGCGAVHQPDRLAAILDRLGENGSVDVDDM